MSLFFWRKNKQIDVFATSLADELYSTVQPELVKEYLENRSEKSKRKIDRKIQDAIGRVQRFKTASSLGVYGKARLHLLFTERLKELGYEAELADKLNEMILLRSP